jgi:hypothetical protein
MSRPRKTPTIEIQLQAIITQATAEGRYGLAKKLIGILEEEKGEKKEGVVE